MSENEGYRRQERNFGIDALKILSMLMVVILHVLSHGGLSFAASDGVNKEAVQILTIAAKCAVNIFALTTGYLMVGRKFRAARIISLWLQVFFYALLFNVVLAVFVPNTVGGKEIIKSFVPVLTGMWWYFTAYFVLSLLIPFINKMLADSSKKQACFLVGIILFLFSIVETVFSCSVYGVQNGYTIVWIVSMYIIGAVIKQHALFDKLKKRWCALAYFGCVAITWLSTVVLQSEFFASMGRNPYMLQEYTSPTVVVMAVALLLLFSKMRFGTNAQKVLKFASPLSFAVYIIHEHPAVREIFVSGRTAFLAGKNIFVLVGAVFGIAVLVVVGGIVADFLRVKLFGLIKINALAEKAGRIIDDKLEL